MAEAKRRYGMVIDLDKCTGCQACAVACKMENNVDLGVFWNRVYRMGPVGAYPDAVEMFYFPNQCMHCDQLRRGVSHQSDLSDRRRRGVGRCQPVLRVPVLHLGVPV